MGRLSDLTGKTFGRLTVLQRAGRDSGGNATWKCKCSCGNITDKPATYSLKSGGTKSCGCLKSEATSKRNSDNKQHGLSHTRLYQCWVDMKKRVKVREGCDLFQEWGDFTKFYEWSIANGYEDHLLICRNSDKGNYEPGNCRWDTASSNQRETADSRAREYTFVKGGNKITFRNLRKFCLDNDLDRRSMQRVLSGDYNSYKGFTLPEEGL